MEELAKLEYEALKAEDRDRVNARLQVWTIFILLVSVFTGISIQQNSVAYVVIILPLLIGCLVLHVRHSEDALRQVRKYLYQMEQRYSYEGYEHYSRCILRKTHGGYLEALKYAFQITDTLAIGVVAFHLFSDHVTWLAIIPLALVEMGVLYLTEKWLKK